MGLIKASLETADGVGCGDDPLATAASFVEDFVGSEDILSEDS